MSDLDEKPIKGSLKLLLNRFENIKIEREQNEKSSQSKKLEPKAVNPKAVISKAGNPLNTDPEISITEKEDTEKSDKPTTVGITQSDGNPKAQPKYNQSLGNPGDSFSEGLRARKKTPIL